MNEVWLLLNRRPAEINKFIPLLICVFVTLFTVYLFTVF